MAEPIVEVAPPPTPRTRESRDSDGGAADTNGNVQVAAAPGEASPPAPTTSWLGFLTRMLVVYAFIQWLQGRAGNVSTGGKGVGGVVPPSTAECAWQPGTVMDMRVYLSTSEEFAHDEHKFGTLALHERGFLLGAWGDEQSREVDMMVPMTEHLAHNGSLYAHILMYPDHVPFPPPPIDSAAWAGIVYRRHLLTPPLIKRADKAVRNLITADTDDAAKGIAVRDDAAEVPVTHWDRNLTLNFVSDTSPLQLAEVRQMPQLARHIQFHKVGSTERYLPTVYVNDFWTLAESLYAFPINDTVTELPLSIRVAPVSNWKLRLMVQMHESFNMQKSMMGASDTEVDQLRRALFETNPWLLGVTLVVSLLHSLFDFLAFKNDIQFWRDQKSFDGLSLRTIMLNIVLQAVILLYLFDNDTSWLVLVSTCVGLAIDVWKVRKLVSFSAEWTPMPVLGGRLTLPLTVRMTNLTPRTALRQQTDAHDATAFKYLAMACFPLVLGYSVYSLVYEQHKSWYSWIIGTAVGFVYTFGFITMTPQLFINYKLKSVAHMPWRTFMYKALNTFVDDLFAFVIHMPTLHRLACFRDDIIFFVYLYQRWVYPVDSKRPNEYGQVAADGDTADNAGAEARLKQE